MSKKMTQKNPQTHQDHDWHRADIVAALHKRGWSLRGFQSITVIKPLLPLITLWTENGRKDN
jgi:hypothetical protein